MAVQSKRMGSRMQLIGKNKCVTWPLDKKVLDMLDPQPEMAQQQQLLIDVLDTDEKALVREKITEFINNGRSRVI